MRLILVLSSLLFFGSLTFAQPGVSPIIEKGGMKYYEHTVGSGQTLWGIQQMYQVSGDELQKANPELSQGLKAGQKILVPIHEESKQEALQDYTVERGETLYGISKKFNTSVDHLIELNPELAEGLKKGQVIKVPATSTEIHKEQHLDVEPLPNPFVEDTITVKEPEVKSVITFSDSIVEHKVMAHETMYSISKRYMVSMDELMRVNGLKSTTLKEGQVLKIPLKKERTEKVEVRRVPDGDETGKPSDLIFAKKDSYKIAVLIPLYLDYGTGYSEYVSDLATQFYMGVEMAIDSLEKMGLKADVYVYDTKNDSAHVAKLLVEKGLSNADMIIGPFFEKTQKVVADFCKKNSVRMICPVLANTSIIENNPFVYASVPSNITLIRGTAIHLLENYKTDNIILIKTVKESDKPLYNAFLKTFQEFPVSGIRPRIIETTIDDIKSYIRRGVKNVFVVPTNDKNTAMKFMNSLNRSAFRSKEDELIVFGTKEWMNFPDVSDIYKNKYNLHFAGPNFLDYYTDEMIEMNKIHRERYNTDFSRMAVQGYDIMMYFCSDFFLEGFHPSLLMNDFVMKQVSPTDGYENEHAYILEEEDFELIRADQPKE